MAFKDTTERNAMNYYISDLHIGHENILRFDNRPFADVNEMNNKLIVSYSEGSSFHVSLHRLRRSSHGVMLGLNLFTKNVRQRSSNSNPVLL